MSGQIPLPLIPGDLSISAINSYLGAPSSSERKLSTEESSAPNWSLAQIFNSEYNSTVIPLVGSSNLPRFQMSDLSGKTFGIYKSSARTELYGSTWYGYPIPTWIGYLGFGTSGMFNPINQGFPVKVIVNILQGDSREIDLQILTNSEVLYSSIPLNPSGSTTFTQNVTAIRLVGNSLAENIINLSVYPSLDGITSGLGRHFLTITLPGGRDFPPIDDDPRDPPNDVPGDDTLVPV